MMILKRMFLKTELLRTSFCTPYLNRLKKSGIQPITTEKLKVLLGIQPSENTTIPFDLITQLSKKQLLEQASLMG